jgi:5'-nucleotidase
VSNDDGVHAEGIDVLVAALAADPAYEVTVYAPATDQSGSGDSDQCGDLSETATSTLSGYPAVGVDGCPADAVTLGLAHMNVEGALPHLVVTGINAGQNVSIIVASALSGTVGAAKTGVRAGIPALAVSQALPEPHDFQSGASAAVAWIEAHREDLLSGRAPLVLTNMNVPTCAPGTSIRGTIDDLPLAVNPLLALTPSDCASWLIYPPNDGIALQAGFVSISEVWVH